MFSLARWAQRQRLLSLRAEAQQTEGFSPFSTFPSMPGAAWPLCKWVLGALAQCKCFYFWDVDREKGMVLQGSQQDFALCQWFHQLLEPEIGVYEVARH